MTGTLPKGWRRARLGECCRIVSGSTPRTDRPDFWGGEIAWATPRDLSALHGSVLTRTAERITEKGYRSCPTTLMPQGAVLFTSRAPIGLVAIAGIPVCTNQGFKSFVPGPDLDSGYLYWCIRRNASRIAATGSGSTFAEVSKEVVARFQIPLPSLSGQRRIAAVLDKADAIRRKRRESLRLLDEFLRSAFLEMFGDPVGNEKGWQVARLADAVRRDRPITYGIVQAGPHVPDGVPYIKSGDIRNGRIVVGRLARTSSEIAARYERSRVRAGDVVFSIRASVGGAALVPEELDGANLTQGTARISPGPGLNRDYCLAALMSPGFQHWIRQRVKGVTFREITLQQLRAAPISLPPLELQDRFSELSRRTESLRERLECATGVDLTLFDSLAQRAFQGKL